jgi:hypothetical protein
MISLLLDHNALFTMQGDTGSWKVLIWTSKGGRVACVNRLLVAGADRNLKDKKGGSIGLGTNERAS